MSSSNNTLVPIAETLPLNLLVMPINNPPIFPGMMAPLVINEKMLTPALDKLIQENGILGLILAKQHEEEKIAPADLYSFGTAAKILKRINMPDGSINIILHSLRRFRVKNYVQHSSNLFATVEYLEDTVEKSVEIDALARTIVAMVKKLSENNTFFSEEMKLALANIPGPGALADLVAFALNLSHEDAQDFLETLDVRSRFEKLLVYLKREQDLSDIQKKIQEDVNARVSKSQREFFLREQLKTIKKELGLDEEENDGHKYLDRLKEQTYPAEVEKLVRDEVKKLGVISEMSPEYNVTRTYLEYLTTLPWSKSTSDSLDLNKARKILDRDHFGLEKVKDRIIEFLAVKQLKKDFKGTILCFVGPPGVGKTSLGRSIAEAMGRKFFRFSLGGMRDEAEIKGHRRTYVGAMPGKIMQGLKRAEVNNPVFMLDEIDKLASSYQGDPASALLEVLDPEQNNNFLDHYLDVPFDLSNALFVATANYMQGIPEPLMDRMELIEIPGYSQEEKIAICQNYILPQELERHGLKKNQLIINADVIARIIRDYAREAGVRTLQQAIRTVCRKTAAQVASGKIKQLTVAIRDLEKLLGPERFFNEVAERTTLPGVVVGLAYTALGGEILFIEAQSIPGKGEFKLTGQIGEVMQESTQIAYDYVRKVLLKDGVNPQYFNRFDIHVHIPAGAVPKDGPSAGITMASALVSLICGRKAKPWVAMTGELSLVGKVLPVGGIKEKVLAAKRAGIKTIILPKLNKKDLREIGPQYLKGLKFHFVDHVDQVFDLVLEPARPMEMVNKHIQRDMLPDPEQMAAKGKDPEKKSPKN